MSKVKIVQVTPTHLVDDKGRVWVQRLMQNGGIGGYKWVQMDLPEEPEDE